MKYSRFNRFYFQRQSPTRNQRYYRYRIFFNCDVVIEYISSFADDEFSREIVKLLNAGKSKRSIYYSSLFIYKLTVSHETRYLITKIPTNFLQHFNVLD